MVYAPQYSKINISKLSKNRGKDQVATKRCSKCLLSTHGWTNSRLPALISSRRECWKELVFQISSNAYVHAFVLNFKIPFKLTSVAGDADFRLQPVPLVDDYDEMDPDKPIPPAFEESDDEDADKIDISGPRILADVVLAKTIGE